MSVLQTYSLKEEVFANRTTLVLRGVRDSDQQSVILRTLNIDEAGPATRARLAFCADVLQKFDHPSIVKVLDWQAGAEPPLLVLDDIQGIDLRQYLANLEGEPLPLSHFYTIAIQLADALSAIHHAQVIHKDLHPGNIIYNAESARLQIIDFGLATLLSREQAALAPPEHLEGMLAYLSPEQTGRMNRELDYRSDFYTLGVTLYELLCGRLPFEADDAMGWVYAHIAKTPIPVHLIRDDVPENLSAVIAKLLSKNAEDRYQSAQGLKLDLQRCQTDRASFTLAQEDISDRFLIPQKLYGREEDVQKLMDCFYRASAGRNQLLTVTGRSGLGKSALVNEVHKPIAELHGCFIRGKFDPLQKNSPYSALKQAFNQWLDQAMSQTAEGVQQLGETLRKALGANAGLMLDFIPRFALLLGELPAVAALGTQETQVRFHLMFQNFIQAITQDQPLVIFIDDLQWADQGTLALLPKLFSTETQRLMVIVAYRDNEVAQDSRIEQVLNQLAEHSASKYGMSNIDLKPLSLPHLQDLLSDTLHHHAEKVAPLAALVFDKSAGNAFFSQEFLTNLYTQKYLNFDLSARCWCWDIEQIKALPMTDNVVELMLEKMQRLPVHCQKLMQVAACVGSNFELEVLAYLTHLDVADAAYVLWPALQAGLLRQEGSTSPHLITQQTQSASSNGSNTAALGMQSPCYLFLHDRMMQAAYESLDLEAQQRTHLEIARLLLQLNIPEGGSNDSIIFEIVKHYNLGGDLIDSEDERLILAELNCQAAEKAKQASAWGTALNYAEQSLSYLPETPWQAHYARCVSLYKILAECAYLNSQIERSEHFYEVFLSQVNEPEEKAEVSALRLVQLIGLGQWQKGIEFGLKALAYLGIALPKHDEAVKRLLDRQRSLLEQHFRDKGERAYCELFDSHDSAHGLAMKVLANLGQAYSISGQRQQYELCIIEGLNLTLMHGQSEFTPILLACYSDIELQHGNHTNASLAAQHALELLEDETSRQELANTYNMLAYPSLYFDAAYKEAETYHLRAYNKGLENGELARALISFSNISFLKLSRGEVLAELMQHTNAAQAQIEQQAVFYPPSMILQKMAAILTAGSSVGLASLDDAAFDPLDLKKIKAGFHFLLLLHYRAEAAFWLGDKTASLKQAEAMHAHIDKLPHNSFYIDHLLQYALLACHEKSNTRYQQDLLFCQEQLKTIVEVNPASFEHKYLLLQAEQGRADKQPVTRLIPLYEGAIRSAAAHGFLQYEALANELYARLWLQLGGELTAYHYLARSIRLYQQWGCVPKVDHLRERYRGLLSQFQGIHAAQGVSAGVEPGALVEGASLHQSSQTINAASLDSSTRVTELHSGSHNELDISSVMKSAQLISSELQLKSLLDKVLDVILENAGAHRGAIFSADVNSLHIEASRDSLAADNIRLELDCLPQSLISFVLNSRELVLIDDSQQSHPFMQDPYFKQSPAKSLLCIPTLYRNKLLGALYLENVHSSKAFPKERLELISLLLAQAAIAIENARLFYEVSELNTSLEAKVEQRTNALQHAIKELEAFSYSVSHDLRAPLRTIKGYSDILMEDHRDSLNPEAQFLLKKVIDGSAKMTDLINGLLELSRVQRVDLKREHISLSELANEIVQHLKEEQPNRDVKVAIEQGLDASGDRRMLYSVLENLLNNAWKYSGKRNDAEISFGVKRASIEGEETKKETLGSDPVSSCIYFVKDNGAGFDMAYTGKLFSTFQRLHPESEFEGTGVGLSTVKRIIQKHGGEIWAEAEVNKGATFYFTLAE